MVEFACGMLGYIHPYIVAGYVILLPLIGAIPMMLFYTKVEKFGMISIRSVLIAIIMFVTGMGFLGAPITILSGIAADLIARSGAYKSFRKTVISYGVFCLWICANFFPILVTADSYRKDLVNGGFSQEYADNLFRAINTKTIAVLLLVCFICAVSAHASEKNLSGNTSRKQASHNAGCSWKKRSFPESIR